LSINLQTKSTERARSTDCTYRKNIGIFANIEKIGIFANIEKYRYFYKYRKISKFLQILKNIGIFANIEKISVFLTVCTQEVAGTNLHNFWLISAIEHLTWACRRHSSN